MIECWPHSDMATMDVNGRIRIVGRTKEIIIRGGANIYPREIEDTVITHPLVHSAAVNSQTYLDDSPTTNDDKFNRNLISTFEWFKVCGYPHERLGEEVCCWVKLRDTQRPLTEKEVRDFCKAKVSSFFLLFVNYFVLINS